MMQKNVATLDAEAKAVMARPPSPAAVAFSKVLTRSWSLPKPRNRVKIVCAGIVRLTEQDPLSGTVRISLSGAAHRFGPGHRIRLQVSGGAHPRFARNPGNGQVDAAPEDLVPTQYDIGLTAGNASALLLPVAG